MLLPIVTLLACAVHCVQGQDEPVSALLERGNEMLSRGRTNDALSIFSTAIARDSNNYLTYFKRATTYLAMSRHSAALSDFNQVLSIKPDFSAAVSQRAKVMSSLGQWEAAIEDFSALRPPHTEAIADIKHAKTAAQLADKAYMTGDAATCIDRSSLAITTASASTTLRRLRARCYVMQGDAESAIADLVFATRVNPSDAETQMLSANLFFFALDDGERAIQQLKTCLHYDPDAKACKQSFRSIRKLSKSLDSVRKAKDAKKWVTAKRALRGAGDEPGLLSLIYAEQKHLQDISVLDPKLHLQLLNSLDVLSCEVFAETKDSQALTTCDKALKSDPNSVTCLKAKANVLVRDEDFDQAIALLNQANDLSGGQDNELHEQLGRAHKLLKISKQKDYYKILGVSRDADPKTIKKRYRTLTKEFHPDKYHGELTQEQVVRKIEGINEAYEVLSTPELRQRFDNGDDPNAPPEQQQNPFANHGFQQHGGQHFFHQQGNPFGGGGGFKFAF